MKFRLNTISGYSNFNLAADSNLAKDYCDSFEVDQYGLYLLAGTEDDWTTYNWKWSEIGVNYTDLITLRFSGEDETLNINGVELSCEGLRSMGWTYIFSSYYREYDEGEWKEYEGVPESSELYYVKMYDSNGEFTYLGYAANQGGYSGNF